MLSVLRLQAASMEREPGTPLRRRCGGMAGNREAAPAGSAVGGAFALTPAFALVGGLNAPPNLPFGNFRGLA